MHAQPKHQQRRDKIDRAWIATCVAAVSEQLEVEDADHVCGVVVSVRKNQDRLCLWLSSGPSNEAAVMAVGNRWKQILDLRQKIGFQVHAEAISGGTTGGSSFSRAAKFVL